MVDRVGSAALNTPVLKKQNPAGAGPSLDATGAGTICVSRGTWALSVMSSPSSSPEREGGVTGSVQLENLGSPACQEADPLSVGSPVLSPDSSSHDAALSAPAVSPADSENLSPDELELLAKLEEQNSTLNFIPDRSRPGLTTTAIGAVDLQGAGGNWATVGRRSRGGRRVHRQREKRKGKGRELADVMERRKVDILCVQETRWKGSKARSIGAGFKLFYYGVDSKRNGVGVVLKEEFMRNVLEVGCELGEKERFWSELDEVMESIPTGERVVIGADFNGHVGEGNTGDEEVMGKFGVKERNLEGQMVVDFAKRMDMAVVNTYFQKREEHRVTYKSGGRSTQKKRQMLRQALGGQVVLPDDWETTAEVIRETGRKDSIQRKRLAKKKWDMDRTEENRQEYKELQRRVKREVSKAKQKAYDELYTRVLTSEESVQRRWKEYFEELMNEENEREKRVEEVNSVEQKVDKIRKDEVRKALKRMKSGKAVGPDDIPVEVWKCLGEAAVEFLASLFNRVLENLEKAYDRVPREELWYCMRKSGVAEKYVRVVQDMYERSRTVVRCAVVMDQLSEEVRQESPWTMMFADDIVICSESREQVEENLERWRFALERRGMKVSRSKTEYMCVNEREGSGTVRLQGEEVKKVQEFKYLGSTVQSNGECGKEVKKRVQAGWNGWRKVSGVLCDQKISARIKGKVYRTVVRAAMLYGLETVSLRKRQESELEVAELKMLRLLEADSKSMRSMSGSRRNSGSSLVSSSSASSNLSHLEEDTWILWGRIVNEWEEWRRKKDKLLKELIRKGIPHHFRAIVWQLLGNATDMPVKNQYSELLKMSSPCEKLIRRDIARTYPEHEFFKGQDSLGQEVLFNVMKGDKSSHGGHSPVTFCAGPKPG
ncbi:hypothetical protein QTP86_004629 [Hemibagrus guttatus]|nr:hypothetical protein QTP86_004629 [Hemibagrus guttatus]